MKKLIKLGLFAVLILGFHAHAQVNTGIELISPSISLNPFLPNGPKLDNYNGLGGIGWFRQHWKKDRFYRTWDCRFEYGTGIYTHSDATYMPYNGIKGDYHQIGVSVNWAWGKPLFNKEFDDRFFWFATGGFGFNYQLTKGKAFISSNSYVDFERETYTPNLNGTFGFQARMGMSWYYHLCAEASLSNVSKFNIKIRFLRRNG
ncbi:MAG: hypothetical protein GC180_02120 [Bacteroidetes bacterium]|nr:hypothetical protein [Bacteroidota bacterium]